MIKNVQATEKSPSEEYVEKVQTLKMPIHRCRCGAEILIVPDLAAMSKAVQKHVGHHNRITGDHLTEDVLMAEVFRTVWKKSEQQLLKNNYPLHASQ